jgi:nitroreductase
VNSSANRFHSFRWLVRHLLSNGKALPVHLARGNETLMATATRKTPTSAKPIVLPKPRLRGGRSLPESLKRRATTREIGDRKIPPQLLSNLLWAACGINRPKGPFGVPGITAASASNSQEIDLFVAMKDGVYLFDARKHQLIPVASADLRSMAISRGQKSMVTDAPVQIIYVVDVHRLTHTAGFQEPGLQDPEVQKSYYFVDTGLIAGNVYLFAASQGLAAWFHNCDRTGLAAKLTLRPEQRVLFAQTVGYPARRSRWART